MTRDAAGAAIAVRDHGHLRAIAQLGAPLVVNNLAYAGMSFADTVMSGHLGPDALAAVAVGSNALALLALIGIGIGGEEGAKVGAELGAERTAGGVNIFKEEDVPDVIEQIPNDSAAAIILLEHRWAIPLRDAVVRTNGMPIADTFIHPLDLVAVGLIATEESEALTPTQS